MIRAVVLASAVVASAGAVHAEKLPLYRGFYTRVGVRDVFGAQEPFHAWAAFAFGVGYRFDRGSWGLDISAFNYQYDPEEGLHTVGRVVPYLGLSRWTRAELWVGAGVSVGWLKGTVDQAIARRRGEGLQGEVVMGCELPRALRVRLFTQATLTAPFYNLRDRYLSRDSATYVYAFEIALGVRF